MSFKTNKNCTFQMVSFFNNKLIKTNYFFEYSPSIELQKKYQHRTIKKFLIFESLTALWKEAKLLDDIFKKFIFDNVSKDYLL